MDATRRPVNVEPGIAGGYPRTRAGVFATLTGLALWLAWVRYGRFFPTIDRLGIFGLASVSLPLAAWILDRIFYRAPERRSAWIQDIPIVYWLRSLLIALWLAIALVLLPMLERNQALISFREHFGPVEQRYLPQPWWYQWLPTASVPPQYEILHASWLAKHLPLKDPGLLSQSVHQAFQSSWGQQDADALDL